MPDTVRPCGCLRCHDERAVADPRQIIFPGLDPYLAHVCPRCGDRHCPRRRDHRQVCLASQPVWPASA